MQLGHIKRSFCTWVMENRRNITCIYERPISFSFPPDQRGGGGLSIHLQEYWLLHIIVQENKFPMDL